MVKWLHQSGYRKSFLGQWTVYLTPEARLRAHSRGVQLTASPTKYATGLQGRRLPAGCG
jgi:hypothetical protein